MGISISDGGTLKSVNLSSQYEVALGKTVDFVSPDSDYYLAPAQIDIRMMPLFLGQMAHLIHEIQG